MRSVWPHCHEESDRTKINYYCENKGVLYYFKVVFHKPR
ncbi:hypothetical protein GGR07_001946 [Bacteroides pyogenes]|nr:hypothetical protein [Bacteroides pyogenes]SUV34363.1 Uncharacterised protein [Bacteroides pyogenes]